MDPTRPEAEEVAKEAPPVPQLAPTETGLRLEIDKSERRLTVWIDGQAIARHPVAVGMPRYQTPSGHYAIQRVDWNPDWRPPPTSDWARGQRYTPPGAKDNPLGRVRMQFRGAYAIHGTKSLHSLGRAASHGCVRMANEAIIALAPVVMDHGGAPRSEGWVHEAVANPRKMRRVELPVPVPVDVHG
jgi:lipoprotein-anchoring transpeptidase ErfK/SrfK